LRSLLRGINTFYLKIFSCPQVMSFSNYKRQNIIYRRTQPRKKSELIGRRNEEVEALLFDNQKIDPSTVVLSQQKACPSPLFLLLVLLAVGNKTLLAPPHPEGLFLSERTPLANFFVPSVAQTLTVLRYTPRVFASFAPRTSLKCIRSESPFDLWIHLRNFLAALLFINPKIVFHV